MSFLITLKGVVDGELTASQVETTGGVSVDIAKTSLWEEGERDLIL